MNIGIIGLGLIGGSIARAVKKYTDNKVLAYDMSADVLKMARESGAMDAVLDDTNLGTCDVTIVALYPNAAIDYIIGHQDKFKKGSIVTDTCGTKQKICAAVSPVARENGFIFIGAHPMAGIEKSGFENSFADMFARASLIITPEEGTPQEAIDTITELAFHLNFGSITPSTPKRHDQMIAYTSQLAHVVSCAYVTSPLAKSFKGFSAGSFKDMTRVAKLNEVMWTQLFIENKDELTGEIDSLAERLIALSNAIKSSSYDELKSMLKESSETKEMLDSERTV